MANICTVYICSSDLFEFLKWPFAKTRNSVISCIQYSEISFWLENLIQIYKLMAYQRSLFSNCCNEQQHQGTPNPNLLYCLATAIKNSSIRLCQETRCCTIGIVSMTWLLIQSFGCYIFYSKPCLSIPSCSSFAKLVNLVSRAMRSRCACSVPVC